MKNKGLIIGFIVGLVAVPLAVLGLASNIGMVFYPLIIIPKLILGKYQNIILLVVVSIIFYSVLGFLIQYLYSKSKK